MSLCLYVLFVVGIHHLFTEEPPSEIEVALGSTALLPCQFNDSNPSAIVHWKKNGHPIIPDNERVILTPSGYLYIMNVTENDSGVYECLADNIVTEKTRRSNESLLTVNGEERQRERESVCVCVCLQASVCIAHAYMHVCGAVCACMCVCGAVCACMCVCGAVCAYMHVCGAVCACMCVCGAVCACMYVVQCVCVFYDFSLFIRSYTINPLAIIIIICISSVTYTQ